jgi:hypothetical protein
MTVRSTEDIKIITMIPPNMHVKASAGTFGSGVDASGIVDTAGFNKALVILGLGATQSAGGFTMKHQSGVATLMASATAFDPAVSLAIAASTTDSYEKHAYYLDLTQGEIKRYLNCKLSYATGKSCDAYVICLLMRGEQVPPDSTGFTSVTYISDSA